MERGNQNRYPRRNPSSSSSSSSRDASRWKPRGGDEEHVTEVEDSCTPPILIGTCPFMCPDGERTQRERLRDLAVFERLHGNPGKTSPSLAVKKFCRTISTPQSSHVRPLPVLDHTLTYLLSLIDTSDRPFEVVHDFVFDRTRSIRQDLSIQNIVNHKAIHMYEKMVKFHILSQHKLRCCGNSADSSSVHYLNMEQLIKVLTSLYNLYDANRDPNSVYENEGEFRSLYVLLHLDCKSQPTGESLSVWFRRAPHTIIRSKQMCFARRVLQCFRIGNYKRFFDTIAAEASFLQYCIIEPHVNEVRAKSLSCINNVGYKLHPYPLTKLSKLLIMKESDLQVLCNACGLEISIDEAGNKLLPTKQSTFCIPKGGLQSSEFPGIDQFER
ncbi:SAC3 family protein C [Euphorbia peplus]|nr:SAC3 family protein C [Euphorbia peplus]